jgi:pyruvate-formate lyase-activating enzyme
MFGDQPATMPAEVLPAAPLTALAAAPLTALATAPPLVDPFGRAITYLRVSVTDRCDFRCVYCMAEDMQFLPKSQVLSLEEIDAVASAFIRRGTRKLRLTGGEPLVRRGIIDLVHSLGRHLKSGALEELTLTSNGSQMARHAGALFAAGVRRVNISLDTLDAQKFARITRWGRLPQVLDGIAAATAAGLKVKLNTVALAHENADEIEARYPKLLRRVGGYNLDTVKQLCGGRTVKRFIDLGNFEGTTALIKAAMFDQLAILEVLVGAGATLSKADNLGRTPLMLAAANGSDYLGFTYNDIDTSYDNVAQALNF